MIIDAILGKKTNLNVVTQLTLEIYTYTRVCCIFQTWNKVNFQEKCWLCSIVLVFELYFVLLSFVILHYFAWQCNEKIPNTTDLLHCWSQFIISHNLNSFFRNNYTSKPFAIRLYLTLWSWSYKGFFWILIVLLFCQWQVAGCL